MKREGREFCRGRVFARVFRTRPSARPSIGRVHTKRRLCISAQVNGEKKLCGWRNKRKICQVHVRRRRSIFFPPSFFLFLLLLPWWWLCRNFRRKNPLFRPIKSRFFFSFPHFSFLYVLFLIFFWYFILLFSTNGVHILKWLLIFLKEKKNESIGGRNDFIL